MNKLFRSWRFLGSILVGGALLAGCNGPEGSAPPARQAAPAVPVAAAAPTVVAAVRHYADLMAQGTPLATPASRRFADLAPDVQPAGDASPGFSVSLSWKLPTYEVSAFLDQQQRLVDVTIEPPRPAEDPNRLAKYVPHPPALLIRLGELRRAFGPDTAGDEPQSADRCYFAYQPSPDAHPLTIRAFLPYHTRTDSAVVNQIDVFRSPAN